MLIKGRYEQDQNFTTVYTEDTMYQIARNTGSWSSRKVGEELAFSGILTPELLAKWKGECTKEGTFNLSE